MMKDWMTEHKLYVIITAIIIITAIFYFFEENKSSETNIENIVPQEVQEEKDSPQPQEHIQETVSIIVDVKGQVKLPGVYSSSQGERVIDVINRAGGLTEIADESQVNFAQHVEDAMVIYIPAKGEEGISMPAGTSVSETAGGSSNQAKINLNKADENELQNLPGIGPSKAAAILEYRETNGQFKNVEDLKNISGIGDKTFDKLKDLITVQ
ncbi:helix-hairpin-helix domain-containing protein [Neobacillus niacini]|uniref:helix-hairpin-helix domain-containing protein n=1 Tax=Neobacillus niacini TaxID=86668 RepID=UPI0021AEE90D|nr:helix-hairpin-helix domain-containing protein [Neobacillus niacini]